MLFPTLQTLLAFLLPYARRHAPSLSVAPWMLGACAVLGAFWLLAWWSPGSVGYTGNGRVALAAGLVQFWATAAIAAKAQQHPLLGHALHHPMVFAGTFWLLAGMGTFFALGWALGSTATTLFAPFAMLWSAFFACVFPRVAGNTAREAVLLFAPVAVALFVASLVAIVAGLWFFQMGWILESQHDGVKILGLIFTCILLGVPVLGSFVLFGATKGHLLYAPLALTKGHTTPEHAARMALAFVLQRHPALLRDMESSMCSRQITFRVSPYGTLDGLEWPLVCHVMGGRAYRHAPSAIEGEILDHLRPHVRFGQADVWAAEDSVFGREIVYDLGAALADSARSHHGRLAAMAHGLPATA